MLIVWGADAWAANTGDTEAHHSMVGAKVTGAPGSHAMAGHGILLPTKIPPDAPTGWTGEGSVADPKVFSKLGLGEVTKGAKVRVEKMSDKEWKITLSSTGASKVISVK
jgi:hypothetical protein